MIYVAVHLTRVEQQIEPISGKTVDRFHKQQKREHIQLLSYICINACGWGSSVVLLLCPETHDYVSIFRVLFAREFSTHGLFTDERADSSVRNCVTQGNRFVAKLTGRWSVQNVDGTGLHFKDLRKRSSCV